LTDVYYNKAKTQGVARGVVRIVAGFIKGIVLVAMIPIDGRIEV
jgi:hypothetical protein